MGMIAETKMGCMELYLRTILKIFGVTGRFENYVELQKICRGGVEEYNMETSHKCWIGWICSKIVGGKGLKHSSDDTILRCQRKANIMTSTWNADIKNSVGSISLTQKLKVVSGEVSREICDLMADIKLKAYYTGVDISHCAKVFKYFFVTNFDI